jgi:peptide/nickel transport system substrate-binding protein
MRAFRVAVLALVCTAGALTTLSGASAGNGSYGGVLVVGVTYGDPDSLDPAVNVGFAPLEIFRTIAERLYDFDAKGRSYPELASALPTISPDGLTYTIPLRKGVEFNDGTPFNAQAVVTSLERHVNLPTSGRASDLAPIQSVTASGPYTVVIHLKQRFTPLLQNLSTNDSIIISPAQLQKLGNNFGSDPIGVGPFMFESWVPGSSITVIKSPYYYDKYAVHLDKIVFQEVSSGAAGVAALQAGDIQALDDVDPSVLPELQSDSNVRLITVDTLGWSDLTINIGNKNGVGNLPYTNVGTPLASSPMLRQAFEEAIDRKTLVKVVDDGAGVPDCTPISPSSTSVYDPTIKCAPYDPAEAKKLVARSGYSNPTVTITTRSTVEPEFIQSEEDAVGFNVVINEVSNAAYVADETSGNFDVILLGLTGSPAIDHNVYQFLATDGSRNFGGYSNPCLDLILANARKATSAKALRVLWHAAFQIILSDRPIIYFDHGITTAAVAANVKGVEFLSDLQLRVAFAQLS